MNERIKKLTEQAELPLLDVDGNCKYGDTYFSKEKFAELLVNECITVARGADGLDATHEAWYLIKEHFGVE
jgi:hypothetical protein